MNGKGSTRRPSQVSAKQLADNWERTFARGVCSFCRTPLTADDGTVCVPCRRTAVARYRAEAVNTADIVDNGNQVVRYIAASDMH